MSDNLLHQIRDDLATGGSFSDSLRKAMILGTRLRSDELKQWVKSELNGYTSVKDLPKYRILACRSFMDYQTLGYGSLHLLSRVPINFEIEYIHVAEILGGSGTLEDIIQKGKQDARSVLRLDWEPSPFQFLSSEIAKQGVQLTRAWKEVSISDIVQIIESAKNRLLEFVLELESEAGNAGSGLNGLSQNQITSIFQNIILDNTKFSVEGVKEMTVFDQRGQHVNYQYNAAGNINFGTVENRGAFTSQLKHLHEEVSNATQANVLDAEIAIDVESNLKKAIIQTEKDTPNKKSLLQYLQEAKALIEGVTSAAGLVTAFGQAIEIANRLF